MSLRDDWSWSAEALYACPCGALVAVQRWRWIDADARPELAARLRASGPYAGACPRCRRAATGGGAWLEVSPSRAAATLILSADRRGDLISALQAHLADVQARADRAAPWLLQPHVAFVAGAAEWPGDEAKAALQAWPAGQVEPRPGLQLGPRASEVAARAGDGRGRADAPAEAPRGAPEEPPDLEAVAPARGKELEGDERGARAAAREGGAGGQVARDRSERTGAAGQDVGDRAGRAAGQAFDRAERAHDPRDRSERAPAAGQEPRDRSERAPGQEPRDRSERAGTPGQEPRDRSERTGASAQESRDRSVRSSGQVPADRSEGSGPARQVATGPQQVDGARADGRREGSGPTPAAPAPEARRREGSGPVVAASAADGRARAGRLPPPSGLARGADGEGKPLEDTFPGRRAPRADAKADDGPRDAGDSGAIRRAPERRPGQELEDMSGRREPEAAERREPEADGRGREGQELEDMSRRAARGQEPADGEGDGDRSALRAAVARALSGAAPAAAPVNRRADESGKRPAAVLPGPRGRADEEASDSGESGGAWSKRQVGEVDVPRPRGRAGGTSDLVPAPATTPPTTPPPAPPARLTPEVQRACLASLGREAGGVQVTATLNDVTARVWANAPIRVRPIHLRGLGYPLVGVRCVAEAGGESLVIDAVVDIGEPSTTEIFKHLAREFRVRLVLRSEGGPVTRELVAPEFQRNAAACLESAQAQLGTGEFPPDAYRTAREVLAARTVAQRLEPARNALSEEMIEGCRTSAGAAWAALERLDHASKKDNLARLTEVDGLPLETYESLRSAVLASAVEFGLPAPARFWRRWLASEQARDVGVFVQRLVAARSASIARGEDLAPEQTEAAWRGLYDLCQHKDLTPPPELSKALGIGRGAGPIRRSSQAPVVVSGEIRDAVSAEAPRAAAPRLKDLAGRLHGSPTDGDIRAVIAALPELSEDDVAGLLPALAELGARVLPELGSSLRAPQRWVRQAAAILLGHIGDRKAEGPLTAMLAEEPTAAWIDAARALGNFGPRVVGPLCSLLRGAPAGRRDLLVPRVARALAELVRAEGTAPDSPGRQAVENLLDVGDVAVSSAARRALATLGAVRDEGAGDDAEAARRFSQLASDAITAPELDAFADDEIDELDVEVGDD